MDREKFSETIRAFRNRQPFTPFTVAMVNGDRYEVDRPDILAVGEGLALLVAPGDVPVFLRPRRRQPRHRRPVRPRGRGWLMNTVPGTFGNGRGLPE